MDGNVVVTALFCIIAIQEVLHHRERKDLYDRIMSRDLEDFKRNADKEKSTTVVSPAVSAHQKVMENWRNPDLKG